ncbi:MAG: N-acetyltransferase DgcN [Gammaproteobacteria bacterium]
MMIHKPYLLFLGDAPDQLAAKTAEGVAYWRRGDCVGQMRLSGCSADLRLPDLTIAEASELGAKTLVIGVANRGGRLSESWLPYLREALESGMDIANGLHDRLADVHELAELAARNDCTLFDLRHTSVPFGVATGKKRGGKRLLTVGTDCSVGKMYVALAMEQEMKRRGIKARFCATGQTGILIAGGGVPVDAVIADFIAGAVETLSPDQDSDHWDVIEGQGSLFHPSFAGVSLGLLHGAQPDVLVMCHEPSRSHMRGLPEYPLPDIEHCIAANEAAARLTNPRAACIGICLNTAALDETNARNLLEESEARTGLPCVDAVRTGVGRLVDRIAV